MNLGNIRSQTFYQFVVVKRDKPEGELLNLLVNLHSNPPYGHEFWVVA